MLCNGWMQRKTLNFLSIDNSPILKQYRDMRLPDCLESAGLI